MNQAKRKKRQKPSKNQPAKFYPNPEEVILLDGRAISCQLKFEHKTVWQALEAANSVFNRVVNANEVVEALTESEKSQLQKTYAKNLEAAVTVILELLSKRELVFIQNNGKRRYFGSHRVLNAATSQMPEPFVSRRRSTLKLVHEAVEFYKRPVRAADIIEFVEKQNKSLVFERKLIVRDLINLSETGELKIANGVRGDGGGRNLYLPAGFDSKDYSYNQSLTWLDCVAKAFNDIWNEHTANAAADDKLKAAVTTAEIRDRLEASTFPHPRLKNPKSVTNAMKQLSETASPLVKRVKIQATGAVLWIPADAAEAEISLFGKTGDNSNKLRIAVKRAESKLQRPVTVTDIKNEIQADAHLIPGGNQSLGKLLTETSRSKIAGSNGARRERVNATIQRIGTANGKTYYVSENQNLEEASSFVKYLNLKNGWQRFAAVENIQAIERGKLFSVKIGRMLLLKNEAELIHQQLSALVDETDVNSQSEIKTLISETKKIAGRAGEWLSRNYISDLPNQVKTTIPGLTAEELLEIYRPLYPVAANIKNANRIITLCKTQIRRIPNVKFVDRFKRKGIEASEWLFDRADALIYAGIKWGGKECRYQALTAKSELGLLRDDRFVLPELKSNHPETKIAAISCLAFLQTEEAKNHLPCILKNNTIHRVCHSAMWAAAFVKNKQELSSILQRGTFENDKRLNQFAETVLSADDKKLWLL